MPQDRLPSYALGGHDEGRLACRCGSCWVHVLLTEGTAATAAEVNVMAGNVLAGVLGELGPQFERATGHNLVMQYGLSHAFQPKIQAGEAIDLIILSLETIDDLAKQGKVAAGTRADIAPPAWASRCARTHPSRTSILSMHSSVRCSTRSRSVGLLERRPGSTLPRCLNASALQRRLGQDENSAGCRPCCESCRRG